MSAYFYEQRKKCDPYLSASLTGFLHMAIGHMTAKCLFSAFCDRFYDHAGANHKTAVHTALLTKPDLLLSICVG